jgi:putative membrane protein
MLVDLLLAIAHHLLIFILFAILAVELVWLKRDIDLAGLKRLARLDGIYGIVAGAIVVVGVSRVFFGLKGWQYYVDSHSFWAKMVAFAVVGLLSIPPTMKIIAWRRRAEAEPGFLPSAAEIAGARRYLHIEATIFLLIPIFAAAMARGY